MMLGSGRFAPRVFFCISEVYMDDMANGRQGSAFLCGAAGCLAYTEKEALAGCGGLWQSVGAFFMAAERVTDAL